MWFFADGWVLLVLLGLLAAGFWRARRGLGLDGLLQRADDVHHHVHRALHKHPRGGTWAEHKARMATESDE